MRPSEALPKLAPYITILYIEMDSEESESKFVWQCMTEGALTTGAEPTPTRPAHRVA